MGDASRSHELVGSVAGDGMHWIPSAETMHWLAVLGAHLQQNVSSARTVIKVLDARRKHGMYDDAFVIDRWFQGILHSTSQPTMNLQYIPYLSEVLRTSMVAARDPHPPSRPAHGVVGFWRSSPCHGSARCEEALKEKGGACACACRSSPARMFPGLGFRDSALHVGLGATL